MITAGATRKREKREIERRGEKGRVGTSDVSGKKGKVGERKLSGKR